MRSLVLITLSALTFVRAAVASTIVYDPSAATATAIEPSTIMTEDVNDPALEKKHKRWTLQPVVGYFTTSSAFDGQGATAAANGWGGAIEASHTLSEHFALSLSGFGYQGSGSYTPGSGEALGSSSGCDVSGWLMGAMLVYDPFKGDGFRLPFFAGLNYEHFQSSTPGSPYVTSTTLTAPGYTFGFSVRFNVGFLRFEPFLVGSTPLATATRTCAASAPPGLCGPISLQMVPVEGINIVYRPLGLSFYLNISSLLWSTGGTFYSLGPSISF